jgi:hypothetical protein
MDITEARAAKEKAEGELLAILRNLEETTGARVIDVRVQIGTLDMIGAPVRSIVTGLWLDVRV